MTVAPVDRARVRAERRRVVVNIVGEEVVR